MVHERGPVVGSRVACRRPGPCGGDGMVDDAMKSPIGYPGGKSKIAKLIVSQFPRQAVRLVSPFIGGGHVEILAARTMRVDAADLFEPLVNFWRVALERPGELVDSICSYMIAPMDKARFDLLKKFNISSVSPVEGAAVFYILNKVSYSGLGYSGSFSPARKDRVTQAGLDYLRNFRCPNLMVRHSDYQHTLYSVAEDSMIYCDPPYPITSRDVYGHRGDMHRGFDHAHFARLIQCKKYWIVSYYDTPEIRALFRGNYIFKVNTEYSIRNDIESRRSRELLIMSDAVYAERAETFPPELEPY